MNSISILGALGNLEVVLCVAVLCLIVLRRQWADYWALGAFLAVRLTSDVAGICLNDFAAQLGLHAAYRDYFWVYWVSSAVESAVALLIVYGLFRLAMAPLNFEIGLASLAAGEYQCQVTILDPSDQKSSFWQGQMLIAL